MRVLENKLERQLLVSILCAIAIYKGAFGCAAVTKNGRSCRRAPAPGSIYCWQHGGNKSSMSYVHEKNTFSPVGPATEVTTKTKAAPNINEGGIKRLFGYEISDVLGDYRDARKMQDETYVRVKKVALNEPFKGLKTISCYYTANKHLLYKITLESDVYAKPDVEKMKTCLMDVSEFFNDKLSDKAKMERTEKGYAARFVNCDYQTLTAEVANGTTLNGKTGKKIVISLVDSRVFRTEKSYDR